MGQPRLLVCLILLSCSSLFAQPDRRPELAPARVASAHLPAQPPLAAEGGIAILEVEVTATGLVADIRTVVDAPPYTSELAEAVHIWRFRPAEGDEGPIRSHVLVIGVFREAVLVGGGGIVETPPARVSDGVPSPKLAGVPLYPPRALESGMVLVELLVSEDGLVGNTSLVHASAGFDEAALNAAEMFEFEPARIDGRAVESFALAVFGFRQPITPTRPRR